MKLLSNKLAKVESYKYEYNSLSEYHEHNELMRSEGFRITKSKPVSNHKWMATYVKYSPLEF